ncbi:MAG: hypothetical protein WC829_06980 [Hyphomicrobium sp.]|jgi:hypothetical protein
MRARTKPIIVEAVQWRGDNEGELIRFFPEGTRFVWRGARVVVFTPTDMWSSVNISRDWWAVKYPDSLISVPPEYFQKRFDIIEPPEENEGSD